MFVSRITPLLLYERAYYDHWFLFDCKRYSLLRVSSRFCSEVGTNTVLHFHDDIFSSGDVKTAVTFGLSFSYTLLDADFLVVF